MTDKNPKFWMVSKNQTSTTSNQCHKPGPCLRTEGFNRDLNLPEGNRTSM